MSEQHKISEYINKMSFKKKLGVGFSPDEVYEAIYDLTNMYNEMLSNTYREVSELRSMIEEKDKTKPIAPPTVAPPVIEPVIEPIVEPIKEPEVIERDIRSSSFEIKHPDVPDVLATLGSKETKKVTFTYQSIPDTVTEAPEIPQDEVSNGTLKHLGRKELLELMLEIRNENERIAKQAQDISNQNRTLLEQLKDKTLKINKAGTLAEATFLLNGVYESANVAAQQYLDNLQDLYDREKIQCELKEADASKQAQRMLDDATKQCERLIKSAQERCQAMETEARTTCEAMKLSAKAEAESYWKELSTRLEAFYQSHEGLKALLKDTGQLFGGDGNS